MTVTPPANAAEPIADAGAQLDWGSVPAWVGSILTGGSLLLGFSILLRDRRKGEREQAERIVVWGSHFTHLVFPRASGIRHPAVNVYISNASEKPVVGTALLVVGEYGFHGDWTDDLQSVEIPVNAGPILRVLEEDVPADSPGRDAQGRSEVLKAGSEKQLTLCFPKQPGAGAIFLIFRDARNIVWVRDVVTGELTKSRFKHKLARKHWRDWMSVRTGTIRSDS